METVPSTIMINDSACVTLLRPRRLIPDERRERIAPLIDKSVYYKRHNRLAQQIPAETIVHFHICQIS